MENYFTPENMFTMGSFYKNTDNAGLIERVISGSTGVPPFKTLYKITQHRSISHVIYDPKHSCDRFFTLQDAMNNLPKTEVLLHISELDIYIKFDRYCEYAKLFDSICASIYPNFINKMNKNFKQFSYSPYQIIFLNQEQKIIFMMSGNDESIYKVCEECKKLFGCDAVISENKFCKEITVQKFVPNFQVSQELIQKLDTYLRENTPTLHSNIHIYSPKIMKENNVEYIMAYNGINKHPTDKGYDTDRDNTLKTQLLDVINHTPFQNATIVNFGVIITGNNNIASIGGQSGQDNTAKEWIKNNPIKDGEETRPYYMKYKNVEKSPITEGDFAKVVKESGFSKRRIKNVNRWYMKDSLKK
jgi:hypothetical protein